MEQKSKYTLGEREKRRQQLIKEAKEKRFKDKDKNKKNIRNITNHDIAIKNITVAIRDNDQKTRQIKPEPKNEPDNKQKEIQRLKKFEKRISRKKG